MSRGIACDFWGAVLGERGWWLLALSALSVLACAHADRFATDMLALAAAEPAHPYADRFADRPERLRAEGPAPSVCG